MPENDYGREPIQIVEIKQPRCALRYGSLPCRAAVAAVVLRTNFALWSEQFQQATWAKTAVTVTQNSGNDPIGQLTADKIVPTVATSAHFVTQTVTLEASTDYVVSVYAKADAMDRLRIQGATGIGWSAVTRSDFNLTDGTATLVNGNAPVIENIGGGWYRCSVRMTTDGSAGAKTFLLLVLSPSGTESYAGDGVSGMLMWGAQVEAGATVSTYKPTTDAAVSRIWGTGSQRCYNTYWTCQDRENYTGTGSLAWRFMRPRAGVYPLYEESGENIKTNPLYMLTDVSTAPSRINVGSRRTGESPLGVRAKCSASFQDAPFDDHVGDYYLSTRSVVGGNFWSKLIARNQFQPGWEMRVYEGYAGQAIGDMQVRFYPVDKISGPDSAGKVTVEGIDPLQLSDKRRSQFPRATDIKLSDAVTDSQTTLPVASAGADLAADFGNTGARRYARIGSEIVEYSGYTGTAPNFTLTGVIRGALGTVAAAHASQDAVQRVGRYERIRMYRVAKDLIENHTPIGAGYIDNAQWEAEGEAFLGLFIADATIASPEDVDNLLGELCRDGLFSIWWDERQQTIPLLAVRPPQETPVTLDDMFNVLNGTSEVKSAPDDRLTRVSVFFRVVSPVGSLTDPTNYLRRDIRIAGEYELPQSTGGEIREATIYSRWIRTDAQALLVGAQLLMRYRNVPRFLSVTLDAKDRSIKIGDIADITTKTVVDVNGQPVSTRWQVISFEEVRPGETVRLDLQSYEFSGRFAYWMADGTPDYSAASDAEKARGFFWCNDDGKMSDGTEGYKWQ